MQILSDSKDLCIDLVICQRLNEFGDHELKAIVERQMNHLAKSNDMKNLGFLQIFYAHYLAHFKLFDEALEISKQSHEIFSKLDADPQGLVLSKLALSTITARKHSFSDSFQSECGKLASEAIRISEDRFGTESIWSAYSLCVAGQIFSGFNESIISEGLFRKSESRFSSIENSNALIFLERSNSLNAYCSLLSRLIWNNRSREDEALRKHDSLKSEARRTFSRLLESNPNLENRISFWQVEYLLE
jgi:hypothetical protein